MKFLNSPWFPCLTGLLLVLLICINAISNWSRTVEPAIADNGWQAPDADAIPFIKNGTQIAYGRALIMHTAGYLGPNGTVAHISNGMDCQNCHTLAGEQLYGNSFAATAITYPQFSARTGTVESLADRVNNCMQRSLNGNSLDTTGKEMQAMIAYINWVGYNVTKNSVPKGTGTEKLAYLNRAADPARGAVVFNNKCSVCHGKNGLGVLAADGRSYTYPPLWGPQSYNVSAGMYRLGKLAGFIKNNMPYGTTYKAPRLSDADAWDVAAYIETQSRPRKLFAGDWPDISKKPVDYAFGPYIDGFNEHQHMLGPFAAIAAVQKKNK